MVGFGLPLILGDTLADGVLDVVDVPVADGVSDGFACVGLGVVVWVLIAPVGVGSGVPLVPGVAEAGIVV